MSLLDEMKLNKDKAQSAYLEFTLLTKNGDNLFCFFEGKDNYYYIPRIKQFTKNYQIISCGGREKVFKVHQLIKNHKEYDKYKKAFFIDKDFNETLPELKPPIFETDCYSIENYYVSNDVFKEIVKNQFHLSETDDNFNICIELYEKRQKEFHDEMLLFNSWYACLIEKRNNEKKETGVILDDKNITFFVEITLNNINLKYNYKTLKEYFPSALILEKENLDKKINEFSNCEKHKTFRGKYEMAFLLKIIELLVTDSKKDKLYINQKISFIHNANLNNQQALDIFSSYAETPEKLINYLKTVI